MLNMAIKVTYRDGTVKEATTAPRDEVALERTYDVAIAALMDRGADGGLMIGRLKVEYLYFLAWAALSRTDQEIRDFDSFLDVISDMDFDDADEVEEPDPTRSGVSPD